MTRTLSYMDVEDRDWTSNRLDALLSDRAVGLVVERGVTIVTQAEGDRWSQSAVLPWARSRYRRPEPAAVPLVLIPRFSDLGGEPDLDRGSA